MASATALIVGAALVLEVVAIDTMYWARSETFISQPGRFTALEPALGSDAVVFLLPLLTAATAIGLRFSRRHSCHPIIGLFIGGVLSAAAFACAMLIGLNTWGS